MINTRLVMALEELFKRDPFNLENDIFTIHANRGTIYVTDYENSENYSNYEEMNSDYEFAVGINCDLNEEIDYLKRKLRTNNIEF